MPTPQRMVTSRERWMDLYRGIAILLVVLFHTAASYKGLANLEDAPGLDQVVGFFDPYRMPLLLLLSGLLLHRALAKPIGVYLRGKFAKILWPLLVWSSIHFIVALNLEGFMDPSAWLTGTYQWFLVVLVGCFLVAPLTQWIPSWLMAVLFIAVLTVFGDAIPDLTRVLFYGAFFFFGAALSRWMPVIQRLPLWWPVLFGTTGVLVGLASAFDLVVVHRSLPHTVLYPLLGLLALLWVGPRLPGVAILEWVGRNSIIFYVAHTAPIILTARYWANWSLPVPGWSVLVLFGLGLMIPAVFTVLRRYVNFLFEAPLRPLRPRPNTSSSQRHAPGADGRHVRVDAGVH